jgi:polyisoprenyl-phosphate glycosyltransferase
MIAKDPRQANLRITLTPMTVMCRPAVSVVAPCYAEEDVLPLFLDRVGGVLDSLGGTSEVVLVDDGSRDRTWEIIDKAAVEDSRGVGVRLMRNHGHQLALTAGLSVCRVAEVDIPCDTGDFRLIIRRVLDLLISMPERHRFVRGLVSWIGGKQVRLVYDRDPRAVGESKYPFTKMLRFAADAITVFSMAPLRLSVILGWVMAAIGFAAAINSIQGALLGHTVPGWSSWMIAGLLTGTQFLMLGIIGAYLGRLYDQSKGRPLILIRDMVGGAEGSAAATKPASPPLAPPAQPSASTGCR